MSKLNEIYKCNVCEKVVEIVVEGKGQLVCCDENMELLDETREGVAPERHIPVIEKDGDNIIVKIGELPHPMVEEHHICFIELFVGEKVYRKYVDTGDEPKAVFEVCADIDNLRAREYCNVHGLWKS
ncbi:desulfoferrodoxin [Methanobrevibacter sp. TMH8]|uniref:desulfoferrodoxin n=1 Tax=Methanobrevibacter sp. TMH8 TaxID=2848611 RepID=UPI001CCF5FC4|nr:desulfoferrodoxin [Methanobrevibacter sp. TMH8]MBZ9569957.1 desulfoferrodoxin [Methanobrevibacter sp. TMH8]